MSEHLKKAAVVLASEIVESTRVELSKLESSQSYYKRDLERHKDAISEVYLRMSAIRVNATRELLASQKKYLRNLQKLS